MMSLFTNKADRKLPLLTQFYQLDSENIKATRFYLTDPKDKTELWKWTKDIILQEAYQRSCGWIVLDQFPIEDTTYLPQAYPEYALRLHELAHILMDELADRGGVPSWAYPNLPVLMDLFHREAMLDLPTSPKRVPRQIPAFRLLVEIAEELDALCREPSRARRCKKCNNVYVMRRVRDTNRFCSLRCRDLFHKEAQAQAMMQERREIRMQKE
jgi:hypothetical protein